MEYLLRNKITILYIIGIWFGLMSVSILEIYTQNDQIFTNIYICIISTVLGISLGNKHELHKQLVSRAKEYRAILDSYNNMVVIISNNRVVGANNKFLEFFDIPKNYTDLNICLHDCLEKSVLSDILGIKYEHEIEVVHEDGEYTAFSVQPRKLYIDNDVDYIIELADITEHKNEKTKLESRAFTDHLTGVYNRHYFDTHIIQKIKQSKRLNDHFSIIMFDADNFKSVNDTYGHGIGDEALKFISSTVNANIRDTDILCRWGGEEFLLVVPNSLDTSVVVANNLRQIIQLSTEHHEFLPPITCSFGVALIENKDDIETYVEKADAMLYKSKEQGRNRVSF